jgi:hypothetical protein
LGEREHVLVREQQSDILMVDSTNFTALFGGTDINFLGNVATMK